MNSKIYNEYKESRWSRFNFPTISILVKEMISKQNKEITLKEAAEMSGYSSDYIGQLIRQGKIQGKQVFSNVSWVTTPEAIESYIHKGGVTKTKGEVLEKYFSLERLSFAYLVLGRVLIGLLVVFLAFLIYVLSVTIDRYLERSYMETQVASETYGP
jgi:hypothetical protein